MRKALERIPTSEEMLAAFASGMETLIMPRHVPSRRWINLGVMTLFFGTAILAGWSRDPLVALLWLPLTVVLAGSIVAANAAREGFEEALDLEERSRQ